MFRLCSWVSIVLCVHVTHCHAQQNQEQKLSPELTSYVENAQSFKQYRCAITVEQFRDDAKNVDNNSFSKFNLIHSYRADTNSVRVDSFELNSTGRISPATIILGKDAITQVSNSGPIRTAAVADKNDDRWAKLAECIYFDPFCLPVMEVDALRPERLDRSIWQRRKTILGRYNETSRSEIGGVVTVKYRVSKEYAIFEEITFDPKQGSMPVKVEMTIQRGTESSRLGVVDTQWKSFGSAWYPVRVDSKRELLPGVFSHGTATLHWDFELPAPEVFNPESAKFPPITALWNEVTAVR